MLKHKTRQRVSSVFLSVILMVSWLCSALPAFADAPEGVAVVEGIDKAFATLQEAINAVPNGGTITMLDDTTENITSTDKSYTLDMDGHYIDGGGEEVGKTVYSIDGGTVTLKNGTIQNGYLYGSNKYGSGLNIQFADVDLDKMTITGNKMVGINTFSYNYGAGIYSDYGDLTIKDSTISDNSANYYGGGIYIENGGLTIERSKVSGNEATKEGAGIYASNSTFTITYSTVSGNTTTSNGGGIYFAGGSLNVERSTISDNEISGTTGSGAGIYFKSGTAFTLKDSEITGNTAAYEGGGVYVTTEMDSYYDYDNWTMVVNGPKEVDVSISDNLFKDNYAVNSGSALHISRLKNATVSSCQFTENTGSSNASGSIISTEDDYGFGSESLIFENCEITINTDSKQTFYVTGGSYGEDYGYINKTIPYKVKLKGCEISGNTADQSGGIYMGSYCTVELEDTVIKENEAGGSDSAGGVYASSTVTNTFIFSSGAIYNNTSASDANDLYIGQNTQTDIITADKMTDKNAEAGVAFSSFIWYQPPDTYYEEDIIWEYDGDPSSVDGRTPKLLTAAYAPFPPAAGYPTEDNRFESIEEAIEAAKTDNAEVADIILLHGKDDDGEIRYDITAFSANNVSIDIPVDIDLNELTLISKDDETLFKVTGDGSLTVSGEGMISGIIDIQNASSLTLNTETANDKLNVKFSDKSSVVVLGDGFVSCGKINVTLDETRTDQLNKYNYGEDIEYVIVKNGDKLDLSQVSVSGITNTRVILKLNDKGDIVAVNPSVANDLFVSGLRGNDENKGTHDEPLLTVEKALELLEDKNSSTIHILDTVTIADEGIEWNGGAGKNITIARSAEEGVTNLNNAYMIYVKSGASLTLKNITVEGVTNSDNTAASYTNVGSMIGVSGSLILDNGATLQNNDVSVNMPESNRIIGYDFSPYSGGAIYVGGGTVTIKDGSSIQNCKALLGGAIYCASGGKIIMEGGTISGNTAEGTLFIFKDKDQLTSDENIDGCGGGILIELGAQMEMSGGTFDNNYAVYGGGVSLGTCDWTYFYSGDTARTVFTMTGGEFTNNTAVSNGGAMYVQSSYRADVTAGLFDGNTCLGGGNYGGGAIYVNGGKHDDYGNKVTDGVLYVKNVLITKNDARDYGGGIAGCNTSGTIVNIKDGSVIFDNTAGGVKCDITTSTSSTEVGHFENLPPLYVKNSQTRDYFVQYMVDGTPYYWKAAVDANGFKRGDYVSEDYLDSMTGKAVYTDTVPAQETVDSMQVIITNNYSGSSGGGIGTNGSIFIGGEGGYIPPEKWDDAKPYEFDVRKMWLGLEDASAEYPDSLYQLNIWILTVDSTTQEIVNKIHNPIMQAGRWNTDGKTSFEVLDEINIPVMLEEVIYKDGRHIWAAIDDDYNTYKDIIDNAIADVMDTMYNGEEYDWYGGEYSPFIPEIESADDGNYILKNKAVYGDLEIGKLVSDYQEEYDKDFTFTITLSDDTVSGEYTVEVIDANGETSEETVIFADGAAVLTLKDSETKTIKGLPAGVTYTATEDLEEGYIVSTIGGNTGRIPARLDDEEDYQPASVTFTNIRRGEKISVIKVWNDIDSDTQHEPIAVQLLKDGEPYGDPVELSDENSWRYTWNYTWSTGKSEEHTWSIDEVNVPEGYNVSITNEGNDFTITNTELTEVSVTKVWDDDFDIHDEIKVQLYKNNEPYSDEITLSDSYGWTHTWTDLEWDNVWTVDEVGVPNGYRKSVRSDGNDWTITNTKLIDVSVTKLWNDNENPDRPTSVTVQLYKDDEAEGAPVILNAGNSWTHTWTGLDWNYDWTVDEIGTSAGYRKSVDSEGDDWTITNVLLTDVTVTKLWNDNNNPDRPDSVTVQLYKDSVRYGEEIVLSEDNGWTYTWTDLDTDYEWTVDETYPPEDYEKSVSNVDNVWVIVNTKIPDEPEPEKISVSVTKIWNDDLDPDSHEAVSVQLNKDGEPYSEIILSKDNEWTHTWTDLDADSDWKVEEISTFDDYETSSSVVDNVWIIVNTKIPDEPEPEKVSISATKIWNDDFDQDSHEAVTVQLNKDGDAFGASVVLNAKNNWTCEWTDLEKDHVWTVEEIDVPEGYEAAVSNVDNVWIIVNTKLPNEPEPEPETISVSVTKLWNDDNNEDRPQSVTVQLYRDGSEYGETVTLSNDNDWTYTWTDLDAESSWTVEEIDVPEGYEAAVSNVDNVWIIVNTKLPDEPEPEPEPEPETISVSVTKLWNDDNSEDRPQSVTVQLYIDGDKYSEAVTLSNDNGWTYTWTDLEKDHVWTVEEIDVPEGYEAAVSNVDNVWIIVNTKLTDEPEPEPETISVSVTKLWNDDNNKDRPQSVTVQLYRDGSEYGEEITLSEENGWTYTWTDLEKDHVWTVEEINVPEGYEAAVSNVDNVWIIVNTKLPDEPEPEPETPSDTGNDDDNNNSTGSDTDGGDDVEAGGNTNTDTDSNNGSLTDTDSDSGSDSGSHSSDSAGKTESSDSYNKQDHTPDTGRDLDGSDVAILFVIGMLIAVFCSRKKVRFNERTK